MSKCRRYKSNWKPHGTRIKRCTGKSLRNTLWMSTTMSSVQQSDTEFAETPVDELGSVCSSRSWQKRVEVEPWADYHDVYHWLLPLESRASNPVDLLQSLARGIRSLPKTQETFCRKDLGISHPNPIITTPILQLWRCTIQSDDSTRSVRYRNPEYMHYKARTQPLTDMTERREFYTQWKDTPTVDGQWFAHHFGTQHVSALNWIGDDDKQWPAWKQQNEQNIRRLGRTIRTITTWTDRTQKEIVDAMPLNSRTLRDYANRFAHPNHTDWRPPERPCQFQWFDQYRQHYVTTGDD